MASSASKSTIHHTTTTAATMPYHHTSPSSSKPRGSGSLRGLVLTVAIVLVSLASTARASVASQFHLNVKGGDVSQCWTRCNADVTSVIPCPWSDTNINSYSYLGRNCQYDVYMEAMSKCLPIYCESSWDVQYAREYGQAVCQKAGHDAIIPLDPTYTSEVGGYYATASPMPSATQPTSRSSGTRVAEMRTGLLGSMMIMVGVIAGGILVL